MGQPQHHAGAGQVPAAGDAVDSDWEYEYDANETEDLYFTLDLTTHVPDALVRKYDTASDNHAGTKAAEQLPSGDVQDENATIEEPPPNRDAVSTKPRTALQIIDLHTRNPLVKFDDGIYSCYWSTDLGTQFHVSQAGVTPKPRRAGTVLDIVGLSQTRLIGKPITLTQKDFSADGGGFNAAAPDENGTVEQQAASGSSESATQPLVIPRELCKNLTAETQASFLERLSQIKLKKGETDPLPIFSIKYHLEPSNKDELKKRAKAADAAKRKDDDAEAVEIGGSRKRRKRLTAAETGRESDDDAPTGGRPGREAIGARVGFEGQAPGALKTRKKYVKSGKYANAKSKKIAASNSSGGPVTSEPSQEVPIEVGDPSHGAADVGDSEPVATDMGNPTPSAADMEIPTPSAVDAHNPPPSAVDESSQPPTVIGPSVEAEVEDEGPG